MQLEFNKVKVEDKAEILSSLKQNYVSQRSKSLRTIKTIIESSVNTKNIINELNSLVKNLIIVDEALEKIDKYFEVIK